MSDDDVERAWRILQRHNVPFSMTDEAALTFISSWTVLQSLRVHEQVGSYSIEDIQWPPTSHDIKILREGTTAGVLTIYKQICETLHGT